MMLYLFVNSSSLVNRLKHLKLKDLITLQRQRCILLYIIFYAKSLDVLDSERVNITPEATRCLRGVLPGAQ